MNGRIKPGCGFWDTTHHFPGGHFRRAPREAGEQVSNVELHDEKFGRPNQATFTFVREGQERSGIADQRHVEVAS